MHIQMRCVGCNCIRVNSYDSCSIMFYYISNGILYADMYLYHILICTYINNNDCVAIKQETVAATGQLINYNVCTAIRLYTLCN